jgi:hypothetical protein
MDKKVFRGADIERHINENGTLILNQGAKRLFPNPTGKPLQ